MTDIREIKHFHLFAGLGGSTADQLRLAIDTALERAEK